MPPAPDDVDSREGLASYVRSLHQSCVEGGDSWENADLAGFLEALAAWVEDADGWHRITGRELPTNGDWRFFAQALQAATMYE
ncbi:hypothetical protein AB0D99_25270 [Streptomyces sp. NPDC047971]|uniref:DUF7660 family protein n=1 Tax=Streptomyces sp. NPDC047971 TaxID=3154499 RepID=UPI003405B1E3